MITKDRKIAIFAAEIGNVSKADPHPQGDNQSNAEIVQQLPANKATIFERVEPPEKQALDWFYPDYSKASRTGHTIHH